MHNKHAEEANKLTAARTFTTTLAKALEKNKVCLPSMFYEAVERSANKLVHSAVQKEREEFGAALAARAAMLNDRKTQLAIVDIIARIKSDREKGE